LQVRKHPVQWFGCHRSGAQCSGCFCFRARPASSFLSLSQPALLPSACGLLRSPLLAAIISPPCCLCGHLTSNFLIVRSLKLLTPPNAPTPSCVLACWLAGWCPPARLPACQQRGCSVAAAPFCPSARARRVSQVWALAQRQLPPPQRCCTPYFIPVFFSQPSCKNRNLCSPQPGGQRREQHCRAVTICFVRNSHVRVVKPVVSASEYTAPADPLHCCW
jgi:hypothetical protein